jgi:quinolinate synthase
MINTVTPAKLGAMGEGDIDPLLDLEAEIKRIRREKNAIILAHYYQDADIQDLADFVGDSLDLSRKAASTDADIIVFCGVRFMAEVAHILSPTRKVLLPDADAGCSLEEGCQPKEFKRWREAHPDHIALTYINCSAEVKAMSDIIVTSSNAEAIIRQLPEEKPILFAPDRYLGAYLIRQTGREMVLWPGTCVIHEQFSGRELVKLATRHSNALITAHPECPEAILDQADHIGSTRAMLDFVLSSASEEFIVATEPHLIHQMAKAAPSKKFYPAPGADGTCDCANCPYMEKNTMEKLYLCMVNETPRIEVPEDLRLGASKAINKMMEMSPVMAKRTQAAE